MRKIDEEVGGGKGMAPFIKSPEFSKLNIGFALDEGLPSADEDILLTYGERAICRKRIFYIVNKYNVTYRL